MVKKKLSRKSKKPKVAFEPIEIFRMTERMHKVVAAAIKCKGDVDAMVRELGFTKSPNPRQRIYDVLYDYRQVGERCLIFLNEQKGFVKQLPPNKRKLLYSRPAWL